MEFKLKLYANELLYTVVSFEASYMAFYFLILNGYFFVSYIFYIENFNMIKIKFIC
jgi:hypothetical protein